MNKTILVIGLAFIALGIYAYAISVLISSIMAIVIGSGISVYALLIPSEKQISKKVQKGMVEGLLEMGEKKIRNGTVHFDLAVFKGTVEKISPIIADLSTMPEIGFDSIYIHFSKENDAEDALAKVRAASLEATIVQNKNDWSVKINLV